MDYQEFLLSKQHSAINYGIEPNFIPDSMFDYQKYVAEYAIKKGRCAVFLDTGLGKTIIELTIAKNYIYATNKPVLIITPLAVAFQFIKEAKKFDLDDIEYSKDGTFKSKIVVCNYERLHYFNSHDFDCVILDESSILKNFEGAIKNEVTTFLKKVKYRYLFTATPSPNDYIELGTSSEAIGDLGFMDMLNRFFKKAETTMSRSEEFRSGLYRFRGHAQRDFWRWICSWARGVRKPSDLGYPDDGYVLPPLVTNEHIIRARTVNPDFLFDMPAVGLQEQRAERRRTIEERCEQAARLICNTGKPAVAWCHLNDEGKMLEKMIPGSVEVDGNDSDEFKEEAFEAFARGSIRVLISKPVIAGFGLNWQHCAHQTFFPSHSFEQWYQAVRRCWRFGQKSSVTVDVIASEGEAGVLANMNRKAEQAEVMFARMVELLNNELSIQKTNQHTKKQEIPSWL